MDYEREIGIPPSYREIWEFLNILEIAPLRRLSRLHMRFIEKELITRHMILGCNNQWRAFYANATWCKPWWKRSLPHLVSLTLEGRWNDPEFNDIIRQLLLKPPLNLKRLWINQNDDILLLTKTTTVEFPNLKHLYWNSSSPPNLTLYVPIIQHAIFQTKINSCPPTEWTLVASNCAQNKINHRPFLYKKRRIPPVAATPSTTTTQPTFIISPSRNLITSWSQFHLLRVQLRHLYANKHHHIQLPIHLYGSLAPLPHPKSKYHKTFDPQPPPHTQKW